MATMAIPVGETVDEFPEQPKKPRIYDYDAMAQLEMPHRFSFPDRAAAIKFRNTIFRPMQERGIQVRLSNRFVYIRSHVNHNNKCE